VFKFDPAWLDIAEFLDLLGKWWEKIQIGGVIGKSWHCKLKKIEIILRDGLKIIKLLNLKLKV
jgi:hypothetical protein